MGRSLDIRRVLVLGAGKVGSTVADMLVAQGFGPVTLADRDADAGASVGPGVMRLRMDVQAPGALGPLLAGQDAVVNALPFSAAVPVARACGEAGVHGFDLTEDVAATAAIRALAADGRAVLMPQCGLAPGAIGMLGMDLARRFDALDSLRLRVGALTRHASGRLRYGLTWSLEGLINEYRQPCRAIVDGQAVWLPPLEGLEGLTLDGEVFEAFHTSGGLGTLCESLAGRVRQLDYKSIRYPGHRDAMDFLLHELRLHERPAQLHELLAQALPHSRDDRVVVHASATGWRGGRLESVSRAAFFQGAPLRGVQRTAIELCTAAGVVGALELLRSGRLPGRGFVAQEQVRWADFLATGAGRWYAALGEAAAPPSGAPRPRRARQPARDTEAQVQP